MSINALSRILPTGRPAVVRQAPFNQLISLARNGGASRTTMVSSRRALSNKPAEDGPVLSPPPIPEHIEALADQIISLNIKDTYLVMEAVRRKLELPKDFFNLLQSGGGGGGGSAQSSAPPPPPPAEEKPPEKTSFVVKLISFDDAAKFKVLKEIRALKPGMQLMESKALIEKLPSVLKEDVSKEEGDKWIEKLKAAGAVVELA